MSFSHQNSLSGTIQQLKEIVTSMQGEDHEMARLIHQMEALVVEIERKVKPSTKLPTTNLTTVTSMSIKATAAPANAVLT